MKKTILKMTAAVTVIVMIICSLCGCDSNYKMPPGMRVAFIATSADITDQSYNKISNESCKKFCSENNIKYIYYRAMEENTDGYLSVIDAAINDDYNVILVNNYMAARAIRIAAEANPDVMFLALDVSADNFGENYKMPDNIVSWVFREEYAGFMAGYAAVKEGYRRLGFMGGVSVPPVLRYGYGYLQGADCAAKEIGAENEVEMEYVYANMFDPSPDITAYISNWYTSKKTEVVFSAAGKAWVSVASAARQYSGKVIGVDVDQHNVINSYTGMDTTLTSAMKGMEQSITYALQAIYDGRTKEIAGKFFTLGMDSENVSESYLQLPTENWCMKNFTVEDYGVLAKKLYTGEIQCSSDIVNPPETSIKVNYRGNIK